MGSGRREYKRKKKGLKLSDGKTVGGINRLTDQVIDSIQNYYGEAIRNNSGDLKGMENAIWVIFYHLIIDDAKSWMINTGIVQNRMHLGVHIGEIVRTTKIIIDYEQCFLTN